MHWLLLRAIDNEIQRNVVSVSHGAEENDWI
jgi:hypothetical protein